MPVGEMLRRLSSRELSEWVAYFELEDEDRQRRDREQRAASGAAHRAKNPQRQR